MPTRWVAANRARRPSRCVPREPEMELTNKTTFPRRRGRNRTALAGIIAFVAIAAVPASAAPTQDTSTLVVGNPKAGEATFVSTCGVCHRLSAAKTGGAIGPDLDTVKLSEATIVKAIENGGASVMSKAALAKYPTRMTAYKGVLSAAQIRDVAAFIYSSTHPATVKTVKATLAAAGHAPKINVHWRYTVRVTAGGKPAAAKVTVQIVDPTGHAHPVQLGTSKKNVTNHPFRGTFSDFVVWPASARGVPLTFRVTVRAGSTKKVLSYRVTPRR